MNLKKILPRVFIMSVALGAIGVICFIVSG